jgi:hypothetical protein
VRLIRATRVGADARAARERDGWCGFPVWSGAETAVSCQADPESQFLDPADAPLVQIPGTGVIWKISRK